MEIWSLVDSVIEIDNIEQKEDKETKIPRRIKTSRRGAKQPSLILPFFCWKSGHLCGHHFDVFLRRTEEHREPTHKLFSYLQKTL